MVKRTVIQIILFVVSMVVCQAAGVIGGFFTRMSLEDWYDGLKKPKFTPAKKVFMPVWIGLYGLMGVALFLIANYGVRTPEVKVPFVLFGVQLYLNVTWPAMFFGLRSPLAGFIEIIFLWLAILATIISFGTVSIAAALLLVPYIGWVSFAAVLNYSIWRLNPPKAVLRHPSMG